LVAAAPVIERALSWRRIIDRQGDLTTEAAVAELFEDGEVQRHIGRVRRIYANRRAALLDAVDRHLPDAFEITLPRGGMALWARAAAGDDTDAWSARALERGVAVSTGFVWGLRRSTSVSSSSRCDGWRLHGDVPEVGRMSGTTRVAS
jgi:GntR family transcriptional regulator/MocR family aminotransferase